MSSRQRHDLSTEITDTVLREMVLAAHAANLPQKFIDGIQLIKISDTSYEITNVWNEDGKPLARWFEHGTARHWVEPKDPDGVLAWESGGPESGRKQAIYSKRHDNKKGAMMFSKGHYVSGLPATEAMKNGFRIGTARLREVLSAA